MTPQETAALLTTITALDQRMAVTPEVAAARLHAWSGMLENVDPLWAADFVQNYYATPDQQPLAPGVIRGRYATFEERADRTLRRVDPGDALRAMPPWARQMVTDTRAAVEAALVALGPNASNEEVVRTRSEAAAAVPIPVPVTGAPSLTPTERACSIRDCLCSHETCVKGWLETEGTRTTRTGTYKVAVRCPTCYDTVRMRGEWGPKRRR